MKQDGATAGIDWEIPVGDDDPTKCQHNHCLVCPIDCPVIIILHSINNEASFGYMKSLSIMFVNHGLIAVSMNFHGCGHVKMTMPHGDLRSLVNQTSSQMSPQTPIFLFGNSLGANIMPQYLCEEGLAGTCRVSSAALLGTPLFINSLVVKFPFSVLMGLGVKKIYTENWKSVSSMNNVHSQ
jgi:predicted alpha/beta-fold hydrolase